MFEYMTYENVEKKYGLKNHTRKCIDGKITSCGNCVGYCMYSDGDVVTVKYEDYNRALGAIINAEKEDVVRDFAIK